jgi:hypothetical protein
LFSVTTKRRASRNVRSPSTSLSLSVNSTGIRRSTTSQLVRASSHHPQRGFRAIEEIWLARPGRGCVEQVLDKG